MFNKPFFWWPPPYYRQEVLGSVIVNSTPPQRVNEVAEVHGKDEIIPIPRKVATSSILKLDNDQVDTYWNIDDYVAVHMERWMLLWSLYMVAYSPGWRRFAYWKCPSTYRVTWHFPTHAMIIFSQCCDKTDVLWLGRGILNDDVRSGRTWRRHTH